MKKTFKNCLLAAMFLAPGVAGAQVTIGSGEKPQDFSVLELISNNTRGLRLPQVNNDQRQNIEDSFGDKRTNEAMGLRVFNTDTKCVETWNGSVWISACAPPPPPPPVLCDGFPTAVFICNDGSPGGLTVADLNSEIATAVWYDTETGGTPLGTDEPLVSDNTYYADCTDRSGRWGVTVSMTDNCSAITPANVRITAYTNVMYDFQHQEFEVWITSGGQPTAYEWFVAKDGVETKIAGAPNAAKYTVPADFMYQYGGLTKSNTAQTPDGSNSAVELTIRCKMTNPNTTVPVVVNLEVLFIRTNTAGYGESGGVKYLDIESGNADAGGKVRIALLNLGQSGTGSFDMGVPQQPDDAANMNDAGDLGDFYQWGRIADGHEKVVWSKSATRVNQIIPMTGNGATSAWVAKADETWSYEPYTPATAQAGQVHDARFITNSNTIYDTGWGEYNTDIKARWGNNGDRGVDTRADAANSLTAGAGKNVWSFVNNNPCPSGWRVPSRYELWDMYRGDGVTKPVEEKATANPYDAINGTTTTPNSGPLNNGWHLRDGQSNAYGGVIITNATGEKVFLPAGFRSRDSAALPDDVVPKDTSYYWSSTFLSMIDVGTLFFSKQSLRAGSMYSSHAFGFYVRCVAD